MAGSGEDNRFNIQSEVLTGVSFEAPGIMAYPVNKETWARNKKEGILMPADCLIYALPDGSGIDAAIEQCNDSANQRAHQLAREEFSSIKRTSLLVLSHGVGEACLSGLTTAALLAPQDTLAKDTTTAGYYRAKYILRLSKYISQQLDGVVKESDIDSRGLPILRPGNSRNYNPDTCMCGSNHSVRLRQPIEDDQANL